MDRRAIYSHGVKMTKKQQPFENERPTFQF
jgi:hypothetical protein